MTTDAPMRATSASSWCSRKHAMSRNERASVIGVGVVPFGKPGASDAYDVMGAAAARLALTDAGLEYRDVRQAYVGYVYGDSTAGQQALYRVGMTGIPIINVNNACATGSTALYLARQVVEAGAADVVLALGFEQMNPGALGIVYSDRQTVMGKHFDAARSAMEWNADVPMPALLFGGAGAEHQAHYGTTDETFAMIAVKARQHAANNPLALFRDALTVEEVLASKRIYGPLTRFQCCPPTCGAAAAVVASDAYVRRHSLQSRAVEIVAQSMTTDAGSSFADASGNASMMRVVGYDMARAAATELYERSGIGPDDVDVCELHDCFTTNELLTYEAIGLAREGEGEKMVRDRDNTYGGRIVTNPSGGLLSKGHPLGATGLAQCAELVWQMRGMADGRQVVDAELGLQHNLGLGGACVMTLYRQYGR
jgi:sterol carrier protein 2